MIILEKHFEFSDWESNTTIIFEDKVINLIRRVNIRNSLLLCSKLGREGMTFYLVTTDTQIAAEAEVSLEMQVVHQIVNKAELIIQFGNSQLI